MDIASYFALIQPPDASATATLILLGVSFIGAFILVTTSVGGGLAMAAMAQIFPPTVLIPLHGVTQMGTSVGRSAVLLRYVRWSAMPGFILGSTMGGIAGALLFVQIPAGLLQLLIGLFILMTIVVKLPALKARHLFATGIISSFLSMFVGAVATFVSSVLKGLHLTPAEHVGTHAVMISFQHGLKIVAFGVLGFSYGPYIPFLVTMIACGFLGTLVGRHFLLTAGTKYFLPVLNTVLIVLALRLIWVGMEDLLGGA